uniref:Uncharacterized protein n=1 Tax=Lotus japonicus TaxID=34305 RepID=I3SX75_LOTJA|nr:unknown [Lotus japonicus]
MTTTSRLKADASSSNLAKIVVLCCNLFIYLCTLSYLLFCV